ncbi:MAG: Thioredoxin [uncultured Sulfurovum sp.]|uniref:Thioredoxin n=1 Tax=uncultured Sulfurovum sp. TaxID=269237 RepID=A0A6S6U132_9BACT|nr:MAG: Thioredoxin [uncultured Sulfurovum sp.]
MSPIDLTTKDFNETLDKEGIVIIDFWAEWCGPCKQFAPIFDRAAEKYPDVTFGKVNIDEQKAIATQYGVHSVPTILVSRDGIILLNQGGSLPEEAFPQLIDHVKALDMDEIRAEIAKEDEED